MITTTTKIDKKLQREFTRKYIIFGVICTVIGATGVILYCLRNYIFSTEANWTSLFLIGIVPLGIGILLFILIEKTRKSTLVDEREIKYTFSDGGIDVITTREGSDTVSHVDYNDVVKIADTQNFMFIYLKGEVTYPVNTRNLSREERTALRKLLPENNKDTPKK